MKSSGKPNLFIITGSNGAGKSTYRQVLLPQECAGLDIFDGDIFYTKQSIEFYKNTRSSKEARKLAEEALETEFQRLIEQSIFQKNHFAYEGHFTGRGAWKVPVLFKENGFEIHLIFCGLNTLIRSVQRVDIRVKKGGFHVSPLAIENNYWGNMEMLDTSGLNSSIAKLMQGKVINAIASAQIPEWLKKRCQTYIQS